MSNLITETIHSIEEFRQYREPWNSLWKNSNAYEPLSRTEGIDLWCQNFAKGESFSAVLVWDGQRLVGGLPLIHSRRAGIKLLTQPCNSWVNASELLISTDHETEHVVSHVLDGLRQFPESILCFDGIQFESEAWSQLIEQINAQSGQTGVLRSDTVGVIEIENDWETYFQRLSGNHRSTVRRAEKKARKQGELSMLRLRDLSESDCKKWMQVAFEIEHRSWKGENGSSILASDGMADYYVDEAEAARAAGLLEMWFLMLDDQPIAFEYCHHSKNVCLSYKIGFDESFKKFAPGKLLRKLQLETLHRDDPGCILDTKGILCPTKAKWATNSYNKGRLLAALNGHIPKLLLSFYLRARPMIQKLRSSDHAQPAIPLGAAIR